MDIPGKLELNISLLENKDVHIVSIIKLFLGKMILKHQPLLDYQLNGIIKEYCQSQKIALRYSKPVWWKCERGHEWKCSPDSRFKHLPFTQCPYCIGQHVIKGETDLETKFPEVLEDFNYKRNRKKPDEIHWGTPKRYGGAAMCVDMNGDVEQLTVQRLEQDVLDVMVK